MNLSDSEILTRVGPGTPMGDLMRHYWLPTLKSSELKADGAPVRCKLLGEELIAFRDTAGRIGVMDHRCPHRCASLFYGRNEEGGLRCTYHGWKYDVDGRCLDQPNLPQHQVFKDKIRAKAYRAAERNGVVYCGVIHGHAANTRDQLQRRIDLVRPVVPKDFGVGRYCGFGGVPASEFEAMLDDHLLARDILLSGR